VNQEGDVVRAEFLDEEMGEKVIVAREVVHVHNFGGTPFRSWLFPVMSRGRGDGHQGWHWEKERKREGGQPSGGLLIFFCGHCQRGSEGNETRFGENEIATRALIKRPSYIIQSHSTQLASTWHNSLSISTYTGGSFDLRTITHVSVSLIAFSSCRTDAQNHLLQRSTRGTQQPQTYLKLRALEDIPIGSSGLTRSTRNRSVEASGSELCFK
jgi:hypothetical protein